MNDNYIKTYARSVILSHAKNLSSQLVKNDFGSADAEANLLAPSVDLFHFLEPFGVKQWSYSANRHSDRFFETGENYFYNELDYSQVLGWGQCTPAWFPMGLFTVREEGFYSQAFLDCLDLNQNIMENKDIVRKIMRHSIQPPSGEATVESVIHDFGLDLAQRGLLNAAAQGVGALTDREDARVLHCANNVEPSVCQTARTVFSTNGLSVAFNMHEAAYKLVPGHELESFKDNFRLGEAIRFVLCRNCFSAFSQDHLEDLIKVIHHPL